MTVAVLLAVAFFAYTFVGAVVMTVIDERGVLLRWYDSAPFSAAFLCHGIFWIAWPMFATEYVRHTCRARR